MDGPLAVALKNDGEESRKARQLTSISDCLTAFLSNALLRSKVL